MSTHFCLELIKPSAREIFIFLVETKEQGAIEERRREHGSNKARLDTAPELNLFSRQLYKHLAKIIGHAVYTLLGLSCTHDEKCDFKIFTVELI